VSHQVKKTLITYLGAALATGVILTFVLQLWRADPSLPLSHSSEGLCQQLWVKGLIENGWYLRNESVSAPFGLDMNDYPLAEGLSFLMMKAFGLLCGRPIQVLNLYFLSTFFLATLTSLFVFLRSGAARGPSVVGALLFAFLPYHFLRGQTHLFLSAYYLIPLAVSVILGIYRDPEGRRPTRFAPVIGVLLGCGGVYYAFFSCYLLLVAAIGAAINGRGLRPLRNAALVIATICIGLGLNLAPKFHYELRHGPNPEAVDRRIEGIEPLSLKVAPMLLPVPGHRVGELARLRSRYDESTPFIERYEASTSTLGLAASVGFVILLLGLLDRRRGISGPGEGLCVLNLAALLLASTGGFGMLFGLFLSPWIRAYNRMSIFIGFFSIFAVVLVLSRVMRTARSTGQKWILSFGLGAILILGLLDQTSRGFVPDYEAIRSDTAADATYFGRIEATLAPGSQVFQLPLARFPEAMPPGLVAPYDGLRPYLHTRTIRWSYGAMKGRYASEWQENVTAKPSGAMVRTLAFAGFSGLLVDRAGYADWGKAIVAELSGLLTMKPLESRDARYTFFDMTQYVGELRRSVGPEAWVSEREIALSPIVASFGGGFYPREGDVREAGPLWSGGRGQIHLFNPAARARTVTLSFTLATRPDSPAPIRIDGPDGSEVCRVDAKGHPFRSKLTVPPGGITLRLSHHGRLSLRSGDPGPIAFQLDHFELEERREAALAHDTEGDVIRSSR
jgi:phosphoglycerol transferase